MHAYISSSLDGNTTTNGNLIITINNQNHSCISFVNISLIQFGKSLLFDNHSQPYRFSRIFH